MRMQVVTVVRNTGTAKVSGRAFDMLIIGGLVQTSRGIEFAEITLDGDSPQPESGKSYEVELSFYPNKEKRLAFKVVALRPVVAVAKAA